MKFWILVIAAVALLVFSLVRERFETYADALADVGQTAGYTSLNPPPVCPVGTIMRSEDNKCVSQAQSPSPQCPTGYELKDGRKCRRTGGTEETDPTCPAGFEFNKTAMKCDSTPVDPTCPGGFEYKDGKCAEKTGTTTSSDQRRNARTAGGPPTEPPMVPPRSAGAPPATTTGGSSVNTYGPTSGGSSNRIRQVFGPQFAGSAGALPSQDGGDTSKTNVYPELLGGMIDTSTRIPGAGIKPPSKNWTLANDGSLPPSSTMGADAMSSYFPFSRTPGDMDILPDPYRVAQTFSTSSYSSKTEPVPFLTDFSAFQK